MLHGRVVRPRGQGAVRVGRADHLGRRELDRHIPGRPGRPEGELPGRRRAEGVRRDPGRRQLKVTWADRPNASGERRLFAEMRAQDSAGLDRPELQVIDRGNIDAALASAANVVSRTYAWPTNSHPPIGPTARRRRRLEQRVRIFCVRRASTSTQARSRTIIGLPRGLRSRVTHCARGGSLRRGCPDRRRAEAAALMSQTRRQAGARAVHALGRVRLGQLRPRHALRHPAPASTERQHRRLSSYTPGDPHYTGREHRDERSS